MTGIASGLIFVTGILILSETVPAHWHSAGGIVPYLGLVIGYAIVLVLGLEQTDWNPLAEYNNYQSSGKEDLKDSAKWRLVYFIPAIVSFLTLILRCYFFRNDPIMYSLAYGEKDRALRMIK